ncbi:MAG: RDD family protein [Acidobacteria bacterium]|nr:RDD family protein [Acidobacteriota bacterium]
MSAVIPTDETLIIETPERVPLHFALASIGNRFLACAVDHSLQVLLMLSVVVALQWSGLLSTLTGRLSEAPKWAIAGLIIVTFVIWSGYFAIFEWLWSGQTPGKLLLRLRVIREDGRPITFWEAAARNLIRIFDMMPFPFYSVGLLSVFLSGSDQRVGDFVAGTVVVREREAEAPSFDEVFSAATSDVAMRRAFRPVEFTGDTSALSRREIEVVETFLRRRWELSDGVRQWMAWRVSIPLLYKLRPDFDRDAFTYEGFLEELLHRHRAAHRFTD